MNHILIAFLVLIIFYLSKKNNFVDLIPKPYNYFKKLPPKNVFIPYNMTLPDYYRINYKYNSYQDNVKNNLVYKIKNPIV